MKIREIGKGDRAAWARMRVALWPDEPGASDVNEAGEDIWVFFAEEGDREIGFAEVSLRRYANGCEQMPVPFLEGIWIDPEFQRRGVGRALIEHVGRFLAAKGFSELCSDALLDNTKSHAAHNAWGFAETERVVYYRKAL